MNASTEHRHAKLDAKLDANMDDDLDAVDDVLAQVLNEEVQPDDFGRASVWQRLMASRDIALTIVAIALFASFAITVPETFLTSINLLNMVRNVSLIGIVAVGMAYLMIAGEIDLSVGSTLGFLTIVLGVLVARYAVDIWLAAGIVLVLGAVIGAVNGLIVTRLGIPSFIVTLAMLTAYRSAILIVSEQRPWSGSRVGPFYDLTGGYIGERIPWVIVWMLVVTLLAGIVLLKSRFGYHVYATGANPEAARYSGVRTGRVKLITFMFISFLCGVAAILLFGSLRIAEPSAGTGFEFRVIGAVIVGGVALTGGRGSVYGVFMGTIIIGMITSGLTLLGLPQHAADVATGILIVGVGAMDLLVRRSASRRLGFLET